MALNESTLSKQDQKEIKKICNRRGIEKLVHFTQVTNLETIFEKEALLPVENLEEHEVDTNDTSRLDNHPDSISLSVEFPNYPMFYKYRQDKERANWVVLVLDCSILWDLDCAFYYENAASSKVRNALSFGLKSSGSFKDMFKNVDYKGVTVVRDDLGIPPKFTTNPQAEVLVFSDIPLGYIEEVVCKSYDEKKVLSDGITGLPVSHNRSYFKPRVDWEIWKIISGADGGDSEAKQKLGYRLVQEQKVQKDIDMAADLFLQAARAGVPPAQFNIGLCYEYGNGVKENIEKAKTWYKRSANNGWQSAEERLSNLQDSSSELDDDLPF